MSARRRRPRRRTRLLNIDGGLYLVTTRGERRLAAERLDAQETALALRMPDDSQAEIEAVVPGGRRRS